MNKINAEIVVSAILAELTVQHKENNKKTWKKSF